MKTLTRRGALAVSSTAFFLPSALRAEAAWPSGPVTFVVGYAAGGGADINARELAQLMSPLIGQQIVVDNKGGAAGSVGAAHRRQRQAGRPDPVLRRRHQRGHQPVGPERHDRYPRHPGADLPDDGLPICAGGQSKGGGQHRRRTCGARQEGSREAHLFVVGRGRQQSPGGGAVRRRRRHQAHPRALQGHRAGAGRRDQRHHHHELLLAAARRRPDQGRQPQGAGCHRREAHQVVARRPDAQGTGYRRRRERLARPVRAGQDARRHPRQDREGHQGGDEGSQVGGGAFQGRAGQPPDRTRAQFAKFVADEHAFWGKKLKELKIEME